MENLDFYLSSGVDKNGYKNYETRPALELVEKDGVISTLKIGKKDHNATIRMQPRS